MFKYKKRMEKRLLELRLTASEWATEIVNKFVLFYELFNDDCLIEAKAKTRRNDITIYIYTDDDVDLTLPEHQKAIKSALSMASRGCPYEYTYKIGK